MQEEGKQKRRDEAPVVEVTANTDIIPALRYQIRQAEEKLQIACKLLRDNGYPESADDLVRSSKSVRIWTQKDGWLDYLAVPDEVAAE